VHCLSEQTLNFNDRLYLDVEKYIHPKIQRSLTSALDFCQGHSKSMIVELAMSDTIPFLITDPAALGAAIRKRRRALGLRQSDVAMQSGVSTPTVSAIENGKDTARIGLVLQICRDLGLKLTAEG